MDGKVYGKAKSVRFPIKTPVLMVRPIGLTMMKKCVV